MLSSPMRFAFFVVMLSVCMVAWECTAATGVSADVLQDSSKNSGAVVTTTSTKAAQVPPPEGLNQEHADQLDQSEDEPEDTVEGSDEDQRRDDQQDDLTRGRAEKTKEQLNEGGTDDVSVALKKAAPEPPKQDQDSSLSEGKTTTTAAQVIVGQDQSRETSGEQTHQGLQGNTVTHGDDAQNREVQNDLKKRGALLPALDAVDLSTTEIKTTTTTAEDQNLSSPKGDKVQRKSTQSKVSEKPNIEVHDAVQAATTTTTTAATPEKTESGALLTTPSTFATTKVQSTEMSMSSPKRSNNRQSANNQDISSSTPLLFAFATLITLAVVSVISVS